MPADTDSVSDLERLSTVDEETQRLRLPSGGAASSTSTAKKNALRRAQFNMAKLDE